MKRIDLHEVMFKSYITIVVMFILFIVGVLVFYIWNCLFPIDKNYYDYNITIGDVIYEDVKIQNIDYNPIVEDDEIKSITISSENISIKLKDGQVVKSSCYTISKN